MYAKPSSVGAPVTVVTVRVLDPLLKRIDDFGRERGHLDRAETIRALIHRGLDPSDASRVAPE
jgi:hypothetical protein